MKKFLNGISFGFFMLMQVAQAGTERAPERLPQNLHQIDSDRVTGFAIYRASEPNATDMLKFCQLGITEMMVLSGKGSIDAKLAKVYCPTLRVVYDEKTSARVAVTPEFLQAFDQWVLQARAQGKKIAFRCYCGCHRTGRLAAYYQMRFMNWDAGRAIEEMHDKGKFMFAYPELDAQVKALEDYIQKRPCGQKAQYCVGGARADSQLHLSAI
jgi:protein-tyrosine phosphatase